MGLLERVTNMETERWVEHMLHKAEVVVLCEMINSNVQ